MPFFEVEFPRAIGFNRIGGDAFSTSIVGVVSGGEQRNRNWAKSRGEWTASLITPSSSDGARQPFIDALRTFFLMIGGQADGFRFYDHLDHIGVREPVLALGGGTFQLQRTYSLAGRTYVRTITKPITSAVFDYLGNPLPDSVTLYDAGGGVLAGTVDHTTGIVFSAGVVATASFLYHIPVRLTSDRFMPQVEPSDVAGGRPIISWNSLGLIELRPQSSVGRGAPGTLGALFEIGLAPSAPGNFTVAHGLGNTPKLVLIQMTSGGSIYFQTTRYDATNIYLTASDPAVTGRVLVWADAPVAEVAFSSAAGPFTVAHGLAVIPAAIFLQMTAAGTVWTDPMEANATNALLEGSHPGLTGYIQSWKADSGIPLLSVLLAPSADGNFTVAHGLGTMPSAVMIRMVTDGTIWFQAARYDATNLYLVASDPTVLGYAEVLR